MRWVGCQRQTNGYTYAYVLLHTYRHHYLGKGYDDSHSPTPKTSLLTLLLSPGFPISPLSLSLSPSLSVSPIALFSNLTLFLQSFSLSSPLSHLSVNLDVAGEQSSGGLDARAFGGNEHYRERERERERERAGKGAGTVMLST